MSTTTVAIIIILDNFDFRRFYTVVLHGKKREGKSTLLSLFVREWFQGSPGAIAAFKFSTAGGPRSHTKGQWFTMFKWNGGTVLVVDSEGTGNVDRSAHNFDGKLFTFARLQSQV